MLLGEYPLLDGTYILDKINKKIEEGKDLNVYEQFYLWSIQNRNKVLFWLFILFIISILANGLVNDSNSKIMIGGADGSNTTADTSNNTSIPKKEGRWSKFKKLSNYEERKDSGKLDSYMQKRFDNRSRRAASRKNIASKGLGNTRDFLSFFPLIDKFFGKIWEFMFYSKISYIIAFAFLVYGFGVVVVPLTILFLLVKYTLKMFRKKTATYKAYRRYKTQYNKQQK